MVKEIRELTIDNFDEILRVWAVSGLPFKPHGRDSLQMIAAEMDRDYCRFYGMFIDNKMVGVIIAQYDGRRGWINRLAIDPDYRAQGLALELMHKAEEFLNSFGEVVICALIETENSPSMACFGKCGFVYEDNITYWTKRPRSDL